MTDAILGGAVAFFLTLTIILALATLFRAVSYVDDGIGKLYTVWLSALGTALSAGISATLISLTQGG